MGVTPLLWLHKRPGERICAVIRLESSSAGEEVEDEDDDGEDEKDVDPATQGVAANQSYDPEDEEDNSDCPKHFLLVSSREFGVRFGRV
jgi:hypothetical protein